MGLYAIVDIPHPFGLSPEVVTRAVLGDRLSGGTRGAAMIQLRAKGATTEQRIEHLQAMAPWCRAAGIPLIVNDDVTAALTGPEAVAGVHLGQSDAGADDVSALRARSRQAGRSEWIVGLSTHDLAQLRAAGRQGPDYVALGPIGRTRSKSNPEPVVGFEMLLQGCRTAATPVVAIGGMDVRAAARVTEFGVTHVAAIAALVAPTEIGTRHCAEQFADALELAAKPIPVAEVARRIPILSLEQLVEIAKWSDDVGLHVEMGLPARFRPLTGKGGSDVCYRPSDVLDLTQALGKLPTETWEQWQMRTPDDGSGAPIVHLRRH